MGNQTNKGCFRSIASNKSLANSNSMDKNLQFENISTKKTSSKNSSFTNKTVQNQTSALVITQEEKVTNHRQLTQSKHAQKQAPNPESPCLKKIQPFNYWDQLQKSKNLHNSQKTNETSLRTVSENKKNEQDVIEINNAHTTAADQPANARFTRFSKLDDLNLPQQTVGKRSNLRISTIC